MSASEHASASDHPTSHPALSPAYGVGGRSARPLLFLIPIAVALGFCGILFVAGLHFLLAS